MIHSHYVLRNQVEWCSATWRTILTLLRDIPGPPSYVGATTQALRREHSWVSKAFHQPSPDDLTDASVLLYRRNGS
jgi:hypothetical protein